MPIWNPEFETMKRGELESLQLDRLRALVHRVARTVPFYRDNFRAGVSSSELKSLDDLAQLPFTTKDDLRQNYPFGMFAVPVEEVKRIHASSGSTGKPTVAGYTRADLELWGELMARTLRACGVTERDRIHNAYGYGLFTGGLGVQVGGEEMGCLVIPMSGGFTQRQVLLLQDFGGTVLACIPSYALVLAEEAARMGVDLAEAAELRVGFFGAEPWSEAMRQRIEATLGLEAYDNYGLTEMIGPGVSVECEHHDGLHVFEDHFLAEIVDPATGERLAPGETGELVLTTLSKEAMPLVRYRTRDRTSLDVEKCACGRTTARMARVVGRTDDMLIVRGVNVYPQLVERVLLDFEELAPHYQIVVDRPRDRLDVLNVWVEATPDWSESAGMEHVTKLSGRVDKALREAVGVSTKVKILGPKELERSLGKARRVVDKREL